MMVVEVVYVDPFFLGLTFQAWSPLVAPSMLHQWSVFCCVHCLHQQIRVRLLALLLLTVCVLVLYGVGWNSCASLRLAMLGCAWCVQDD